VRERERETGGWLSRGGTLFLKAGVKMESPLIHTFYGVSDPLVMLQLHLLQFHYLHDSSKDMNPDPYLKTEVELN
jgi:hypothetical protein